MSGIISSLFGKSGKGKKTEDDGKLSGGLFGKSSKLNKEVIQKKENKRHVIQIDRKQEEQKEEEKERLEAENLRELQESERKERRKSRKEKAKMKQVDEEKKEQGEDEEDPDLEARYFAKLEKKEEEEEGEEEEAEEEDEEEQNEEKNEEKHEEKKEEKNEETKAAPEAKTINMKTEEMKKAERTIFVGNVPSAAMKNKQSIKKFKRVFTDYVKGDPTIERQPIKSLRFRSLHTETGASRKAAYIMKKVDENAVVNSYIVFKNEEDSLKALELNGVVFLDHHLRIDHLTHPRKQENKLCVFVGNLDFEENEESLWKFFSEHLADSDDKDDGSKAANSIVTNVRIVRDTKTNFGKGFAIVQFKDVNYVEKALLLDGKKLTGSEKPRKLRIARCKSAKKITNQGEKRKKRARDHFDSHLTQRQRSVIGRAHSVLGKRDRREVGMPVVEGERAKEGAEIRGLTKGKRGKRGKDGKKLRWSKRRKRA